MPGLSIPYVQSHPAAFLGPTFASPFVQAMQTGFLIAQSVKFWSRAEQEQATVKFIVAVVTILAFFQTGASFYALWVVHVTRFGDWFAPLDLLWPDRLQPVLTACMAAPVQAFFIWRCWILTRKSLWTLIPLTCLLLGCIATSAAVTAKAFTTDWYKYISTQPVETRVIYIDVEYVVSVCFSAALDIAVTSILLTYLLRQRSNIVTPRFRRIVRRLIAIAWEAAVPPCACAVTTVIFYVTFANYNYWDAFLQCILGKLYAISLFVTLNGRADLQREAQCGRECEVPDIYWRSVPQIRITTEREGNRMHSVVSESSEARPSDVETPVDNHDREKPLQSHTCAESNFT